MRYTRIITAALLTVSALLVSGCSTSNPSDTVIRVASSSTPMTDIVAAAAEVIEDGYRVELVHTSGVFTPNVILNDGEVDANFIQHPPHMEDFNRGNNGNLVVVQPVYYVIGGFYSREYPDLSDLPHGASVSIPNDSNQGRALALLEDGGLITLAKDVDRFDATTSDITDNPKHLRFIAVDLSNANVSYSEVDAAYLLASYARQLDLFPDTDALATDEDERFAVSLVARADNVDSDKIRALARAFTSDRVREVLEEFNQPAAF